MGPLLIKYLNRVFELALSLWVKHGNISSLYEQQGFLSSFHSYPVSEVRGDGQEEEPHAQGVMAVRAQEGLEEPSHIEGQEGWWEEIPLIQGKK